MLLSKSSGSGCCFGLLRTLLAVSASFNPPTCVRASRCSLLLWWAAGRRDHTRRGRRHPGNAATEAGRFASAPRRSAVLHRAVEQHARLP